MQEFFSIGEVARLNGTTVKALRYYEKIGIFRPAYINENTGYRYYSSEQMIVLDFILTCLDIGIPLKKVSGFIKNGEIDVDRILQEGIKAAEREKERIDRTEEKLKNMYRHVEESEKISAEKSCYTRFIPERFLLTRPLNELFPSLKTYMALQTDLFFQIEKEEHSYLYNHGLLYWRTNGEIKPFAFGAIEKAHNAQQIMIIPAGYYKCQCVGHNLWQDKVKAFIEEYTDKEFILIQERYSKHVSNETFLEIQILENL
ncbi:MAG: MerR family transcriptional regulator [Acutalibacteraceae bacterium]